MNNQGTVRKKAGKAVAAVAAAAMVSSAMALPASAISADSGSSAEKYYASVVNKTASAIAKGLSENKSDASTTPAVSLPEKSAAKVKFKMDVGKTAAQAIGLKDAAAVEGDLSIKADKDFMGIKSDIKINGTKVIDPVIVADTEAVYAQIPKFSSKWLYVPNEELAAVMEGMAGSMAGMAGAGGASLMAVPGMDMTAMTSSAPVSVSNKQMSAIVKRYTDVYLKHVKNVKLEKNVTKEASAGYTNTFTVATVTYTEKEFGDFAIDMIDTLKTDPDLAAIWNSVNAAGGSWEEMIGSSVSLKPSEDRSEDKLITVKSYINSDNVITGYEMYDSANTVSISVLNFEQGNKAESDTLVIADGSRTSVIVSAEEEGKSVVVTGKVRVSDAESKAAVNISVKGDEKDSLKMRVTGKMTDKDGTKSSFKSSADFTDKSVKTYFDMSVNGEHFMGCSAKITECDYDSVKLPATAKDYDPLKEEERQAYTETIDQDSLKESIGVILGILDPEVMQQVMTAFMSK